MNKTTNIPFILITTVIQLLMIPRSYKILYAIAQIFHEPYSSSHLPRANDFYGLTLWFLRWFVIIGVTLTAVVHEFFKSNRIAASFHVAWIIFVIWFTQGSLYYRPYTHGLLLLCIVLTIPCRMLVRKSFHR